MNSKKKNLRRVKNTQKPKKSKNKNYNKKTGKKKVKKLRTGKNIRGGSDAPSFKKTCLEIDDIKDSKFLGEGAFGSVFEVIGKDTKKYALKQQPGAKEKCKYNPFCDVIKEIKILTHLSSREEAEKHIATLQRPYPRYYAKRCYDMLMPKADMDLTTFLIGLMPEKREQIFVPFMRQICEAVSFIHRHNVVHKDLKPDNILVYVGDNNQEVIELCNQYKEVKEALEQLVYAKKETRDVSFIKEAKQNLVKKKNALEPIQEEVITSELINSLNLKITDFGCSEKGEKFKKKKIAGSLLYMSPEMLNEEIGEFKLNTDIWAIGCIGLEILGQYISLQVDSKELFKELKDDYDNNLDKQGAAVEQVRLIHEKLLDTVRYFSYTYKGTELAVPFFKQIFKNKDERVNNASTLLPVLKEIEEAEGKSDAKTEAKEGT